MESDEEKYETVVTYTTLAREAEPTRELLEYRRQERERDQRVAEHVRTRSDLRRSGLLGPYYPYQMFQTTAPDTERSPSPDPGVEFCNQMDYLYEVGGDWRDPEDRMNELHAEEDRVPPPEVIPWLATVDRMNELHAEEDRVPPPDVNPPSVSDSPTEDMRDMPGELNIEQRNAPQGSDSSDGSAYFTEAEPPSMWDHCKEPKKVYLEWNSNKSAKKVFPHFFEGSDEPVWSQSRETPLEELGTDHEWSDPGENSPPGSEPPASDETNKHWLNVTTLNTGINPTVFPEGYLHDDPWSDSSDGPVYAGHDASLGTPDTEGDHIHAILGTPVDVHLQELWDNIPKPQHVMPTVDLPQAEGTPDNTTPPAEAHQETPGGADVKQTPTFIAPKKRMKSKRRRVSYDVEEGVCCTCMTNTHGVYMCGWNRMYEELYMRGTAIWDGNKEVKHGCNHLVCNACGYFDSHIEPYQSKLVCSHCLQYAVKYTNFNGVKDSDKARYYDRC